MSSRDWSEAYFADESSVHGRDPINVGISTDVNEISVLVDKAHHADSVYRAAKQSKDNAIASVMSHVDPLPPKVEAWLEDNEVAYQGMRPMPQWVADAVAAYRAAREAATEAATEAFLDSDNAEDIIDALTAAKIAQDAAWKDVQDAQNAADSRDPIKGTAQVVKDMKSSGAVILVAASSSDAQALARATGWSWATHHNNMGDYPMIWVAGSVRRFTHPRNPDRFIPDRFILSRHTVQCGFDSDVRHAAKNIGIPCDTV